MDNAIAISTLPLVPSSSVIKNENEVISYWKKLIHDWGLPRHINHFPGSHPVNIERKDIPFLEKNKNDFLASLKSDGVRYVLYMTFRPGTKDPVSILIDRSKNMYEIEVWAPESYYNGTILDGELVWNLPDNQTCTYLVFDVILSQGKSYKNSSYDIRLKKIEDILFTNDMDISIDEIEDVLEENDKIVSVNNRYSLSFRPKKFTSLNTLDTLWEERHKIFYRQDGIIFNKVSENFKVGSENKTFKWKPSYSIDVVIKNGNIYANDFTNNSLVEIKTIRNKAIFLVKNKVVFEEGDIVECDVHIENNIFNLFPMRKRKDKDKPNILKTIDSTCTCIEDMIEVNELVKIFC
mgnify:FL=1